MTIAIDLKHYNFWPSADVQPGVSNALAVCVYSLYMYFYTTISWLKQEILTNGEGSVQLTSSFRKFVL